MDIFNLSGTWQSSSSSPGFMLESGIFARRKKAKMIVNDPECSISVFDSTSNFSN